jgi:TRAP-type C4-dicarboxylate transport system permease small subunit
MQIVESIIVKLSKFMDVVAGLSLTFIMLLTACDVVLRYFGMPVPGTYELVSLGGALAVGLSSALTFWLKGHISTDFVIEKFSAKVKTIFEVVTRFMALIIVAAIAYNLIGMGSDMRKAREVTPTLNIPFYPVSWALGVSFLLVCLILVFQIINAIKGSNHE